MSALFGENELHGQPMKVDRFIDATGASSLLFRFASRTRVEAEANRYDEPLGDEALRSLRVQCELLDAGGFDGRASALSKVRPRRGYLVFWNRAKRPPTVRRAVAYFSAGCTLLAEVGLPPMKSHFTCSSCFCWVADKSYRVNKEGDPKFLPSEVAGRKDASRSIWLFVRPQQSQSYCYVGRLGRPHMMKLSGGENHGEGHFNLTPALPSAVWSGLGGFEPGDLDHAVVDKALSRLGRTNRVDDRLDAVQQVVRYWHGAICDQDGLPEGELQNLQLPRPLSWWYRWAGRRKKILSGQNYLLSPEQLKLTDDGLLVFYGENQWCYEWATLPEGEDPPIWGREGDPQPWAPEGITCQST
jgi:hypothetical protein